MSCDAVAVSAALLFASFTQGPQPAQPSIIQVTDRVAPPSVAHEPLFMDIVRHARALKAQVDAYRRLHAESTAALPNYDAFRAQIAELAALDMQGHTTLAQRGATDDLKCILRGISQDLPTRLQALEQAATPQARDSALRDMAYLLNDNVEVITSPPQPAA